MQRLHLRTHTLSSFPVVYYTCTTALKQMSTIERERCPRLTVFCLHATLASATPPRKLASNGWLLARERFSGGNVPLFFSFSLSLWAQTQNLRAI